MLRDSRGEYYFSPRVDCVKYSDSKKLIYSLSDKSYREGLSEKDITAIKEKLAINEGDFRRGLKELIKYQISPQYHCYFL